LAVPACATGFRTGVSSISRGFHRARSFGGAVLGGVCALIDGAVGGLIFAWLSNPRVGRTS
jgi:hypothetical protein